MNLKSICIAVIAYITPAPSVQTIVADLDRTLGKLSVAEERLAAKAVVAEKKAAALVQSAVAHRIHAGRARRVAARISSIIE